MTRLTRAESQARTRTQLLATARELFLRDGYLATSLDKVADAAGFSKGAVYSNFRNKDQLCLAVLDEIRAERAAEVTALLIGPGVEERLRRFEEWAERVIGDPQWTTLEFEFAVQARRDPALRQELASRLAAVGEVVRSAVAGLTSTAPVATGHANTEAGAGDEATAADRTARAPMAANDTGTADDEASGDRTASADPGRRGGLPTAVDAAGHGNAEGSAGNEPAAASTSPGEHEDLPMAVDEAAVALLCLGVGLGLFRSIDPGLPVGALVNTVRVLAGLPARR